MKYPYYESKQKLLFTNHNTSSYSFPSHFHSFVEIAYCFKGKQCVRIGEKIYELYSGDAVFIFPYIAHEYLDLSNCSDDTESLSIMCNADHLLKNFPIFSKQHPENPLIKKEQISNDIRLAFAKILEKEDLLSRLGLTYIIFSDFLKQVDLILNTPSDNPELAAVITKYIQENFIENLSISKLALKFGYSQSYIAHVFCDQLKIPFRTYLNSIRCEYASEQLSTTTKSITSIAYESGFNSLNTFCRCFKKNFNLTPLQYKKKKDYIDSSKRNSS